MWNRFSNNTLFLTIKHSSNFVFVNSIVRNVSLEVEKCIHFLISNPLKYDLYLFYRLRFIFLPKDMRDRFYADFDGTALQMV